MLLSVGADRMAEFHSHFEDPGTVASSHHNNQTTCISTILSDMPICHTLYHTINTSSSSLDILCLGPLIMAAYEI